MTNIVPERLTAFKVYASGSPELKGLTDIKLPSFENLKATVTGAGIAGEYESPTIGHFGSMKLTMNWRTLNADLLKLLQQGAQKLECYGAFQSYDAGLGKQTVQKVRVIVQGPTLKVDPGKFEANASTAGSAEIEVLYIKIEVAGRLYVEIDKLNFKCVIDGVDQMAAVRTALGM